MNTSTHINCRYGQYGTRKTERMENNTKHWNNVKELRNITFTEAHYK